MVDATKNKRGRPALFNDAIYAIYFDMEKRTAQNMYYAGKAIMDVCEQKPGDFFISDKGNLRRQGIAEQIGRMYEQDGYKKEFCKEIADIAIKLYDDGYKSKDIENWLRKCRKTNEWG